MEVRRADHRARLSSSTGSPLFSRPQSVIDGMTARGICTVPVPGEWDWDWHGSILFVVTLYSTIGYGASRLSRRSRRPSCDTRGLGAGFFAPKTSGGRVFSILFSFFGIGVYAAGLNQLVSVSRREPRSPHSHCFTDERFCHSCSNCFGNMSKSSTSHFVERSQKRRTATSTSSSREA